MADLFTPGETALVVPVPEADDVVGAWRRQFDPAAEAGVPAHVTVLYPWVPSFRLSDGVRTAVRELVAGQASFEARFTRIERRPDVLWLRPDSEQPFRTLTESVAERWPEYPPYAGRFDDVIPHLTIADGEIDRVPTHVDEAVVAALPIVTHAEAVHLLLFEYGRWSTRETFPLGG